MCSLRSFERKNLDVRSQPSSHQPCTTMGYTPERKQITKKFDAKRRPVMCGTCERYAQQCFAPGTGGLISSLRAPSSARPRRAMQRAFSGLQALAQDQDAGEGIATGHDVKHPHPPVDAGHLGGYGAFPTASATRRAHERTQGKPSSLSSKQTEGGRLCAEICRGPGL